MEDNTKGDSPHVLEEPVLTLAQQLVEALVTTEDFSSCSQTSRSHEEQSSFGTRKPVLYNYDSSVTVTPLNNTDALTSATIQVPKGACSNKERPPAEEVNYTPNSSSSSRHWEENCCRICYDGLSKGPLLRACLCGGSVGLVHEHCLSRWLSTSKNDKCEICLSPYPVRIEVPGVCQWLTGQSGANPWILLLDLISFVIMLPLVSLCNYLVWTSVRHFQAIQLRQKTRNFSFWEVCFGIVVTPFLTTCFVLWTLCIVRTHHKNFSAWKQSHKKVTLKSDQLGDRKTSNPLEIVHTDV